MSTKQFYIRWALFWPNQHKVGVWSQASTHEADRPSSFDLTGLVRAEIHVKPFGGSPATNRAVICEGQDFKEFQWIGQVRKPIGVGFVKAQPEIVGLTIVQKDGKKTTFFKDGTIQQKG